MKVATTTTTRDEKEVVEGGRCRAARAMMADAAPAAGLVACAARLFCGRRDEARWRHQRARADGDDCAVHELALRAQRAPGHRASRREMDGFFGSRGRSRPEAKSATSLISRTESVLLGATVTPRASDLIGERSFEPPARPSRRARPERGGLETAFSN